jgi:uroporphyrinogen-III decarboxylase
MRNSYEVPHVTAPAFDTFSLSRRMGNFCYDIFNEPDLVKAACERATPDIINTVFKSAKRGDRVAIFAMRSSASFISPDMFEKFAFPYLKQMVLAFHEKGITPVIHADGKWLPMLRYFQKLPPKSCIIALDDSTDIVKAKEMLHGHQCIRGNLPANILAFGTERDTQAYCDKLVELAMDGGFIIGSGCEVPLNAKLENVRVLMNCTK